MGGVLTSTAIATGASVSANFDIGLMMTSHMEMMVGGAYGDATCTFHRAATRGRVSATGTGR
jgi:hypothetical protein